MENKQRKHRDFLQNAAIALLSVLAVVLFAQTQLYMQGANAVRGYFHHLDSSSESMDGSAAGQLTGLAAPVRIAVTGTYGRYGNVTLTTTNDAFNSLATLLQAVLGSAQSYQVCDRQDFLTALSGTSVYYDFLSPLPLPVIAGLVGAEWNGDASARRIIISGQENGVLLYLWDDAQRYLCYTTAVPLSDLEEKVGLYELANDMFAFDMAASETSAQKVDPCSLLLAELPALPTLSVGDPLSSTSWLLKALGFNPNTKSRYFEPSGTEVITEGDRTLRIRPDSNIYYQSGGDPLLRVSAAEETPTLQEAAAGAGALLNSILSSFSGDAGLYLSSIQQSGSTTVLTYDYQVGGVPVRLSSGCAAEITLSGATVSTLSLQLRQYTADSEDSLLLPLRQALAIAALQPGAELAIGYADSGGSTINANWLED